MDIKDLVSSIDQTILRPEATIAEIREVCRQGAAYGFASVFVHPAFVELVATELAGSGVRVGTTCGFPFGENHTSAKVFEAETAVRQGADEVDMVQNISWLKSGMTGEVSRDIAAVVSAAKALGERDYAREIVIKVIIEAGLLTREEKVSACEAAVAGGADFVKTSTSFLAGGATIEDVILLRECLPEVVKVKASGGIRDLRYASELLAAGAARLGTSAGVAIVEEYKGR